jgi:methanethiol S-methyltransferase
MRRPARLPRATVDKNGPYQSFGTTSLGTQLETKPVLTRSLALIYGAACYCVFLGVAIYASGFIVGLYTPTILDGVPARPLSQALLIDVGLLVAFAIQHSGMARRSFKRWWSLFVPGWAERSTYVLFSSLAMIVLFACWEPIGGVIWSGLSGAVYAAIIALYVLGWVVLLYATFLIDHFELFGLAQTWRRWSGAAHRGPQFHTPGLYRYVRPPIYLGWLLIFWAAPTMTLAHLIFALGTTAYMLCAIQLEERDLVEEFGDRYLEYRRHTPMLIPGVTSQRHGDRASQPGGATK